MKSDNAHILFVMHLPPPVHGQSVVSKQIHDSSQINETFRTDYVNLSTSDSMKNVGRVDWRTLVRFVRLIGALLSKLTGNRYDACYFTLTASGRPFMKDAVLVALLRLFRIPLIFHLHNKGVSSGQSRRFKRWLYRFVFRDAEVILLSELLYPDIREYVPRERLHICANGVDSPPSREIENPRPKTDSSATGSSSAASETAHSVPQRSENDESKPAHILFLSNLIESKGVVDLLEACAILRERGSAFRCSFIGSEGDISADMFERHVLDLGLESEVDYLGTRYGEEKDACFRDADIFAFPTFYHFECFPLVLLEAMSYGLPVVSTDEGAISEIVQHGGTGFICEKRNPDDLADCLDRLIGDEELRLQMSRNARERQQKYYTTAVFEKNMAQILERISSPG